MLLKESFIVFPRYPIRPTVIKMTTKELLSAIISASEKAANIARVCRKNQDLFNLLIQEKTGSEKNERFVNDFKTLADVLIQETIKHDIGKLFPAIRDSIKGEENNTFENILGESISVVISDDPEETKTMLIKVLDGNEGAAAALADEVHKDVSVEEFQDLPEINACVDHEKVGILIDPIDATAEYIAANNVASNVPNIQKSGLMCATVLIGAYNKQSTKPIIGVINQPFSQETDDGFKSKIYWGASINGENHHNATEPSSENARKVAVISSSETRRGTLESAGYKTVIANGTGYKILKVIENDASIYFLTKDTTFKWDTCAGQAILNAIGGDVIDLQASIKKKKPISLTYGEAQDKCNRTGLIAYRSVTHLINLIPSFL